MQDNKLVDFRQSGLMIVKRDRQQNWDKSFISPWQDRIEKYRRRETGSFFGWQNPSGMQLTYGKLLELSSVISYTTSFKNDHTVLYATEELVEELSDAEFGDAADKEELES